MIWRIEIGGIELFGVDKKNNKGDKQAKRTPSLCLLCETL